MSAYLIDWITISQVHSVQSAQLPIVNGGYVVSLSNVNGELVEDWNCDKRLRHEGSYDTAVQLSCDGTIIKLSGNVSRLGRFDNVFGLDFNAVIAKCNAILARYNLPPFTPSTYSEGYFCDRTGKFLINRDGATITRIDVTKNYETGSPENAQTLINWLNQRSVAHVLHGRSSDGATVWWGKKGGRRYTKAYIKYLEMIAHTKNRLELEKSKIFNHCKNNGLVRVELELDRKTLEKTGMRYLENVTMNALIEAYDERSNELIDVPMINLERFNFDDLPRAIRSSAIHYFNGTNLRELLPRTTFFSHAKKLRPYGIDISIIYFKEHKIQPIINVIEMRPAIPPLWYSLDADIRPVSKLRIV